MLGSMASMTKYAHNIISKHTNADLQATHRRCTKPGRLGALIPLGLNAMLAMPPPLASRTVKGIADGPNASKYTSGCANRLLYTLEKLR